MFQNKANDDEINPCSKFILYSKALDSLNFEPLKSIFYI